MGRTTLAIDEDLLRRLKQAAAAQGKTLQELTNQLLRQALTRPRPTAPFTLRLRGWDAREQPGVDIRDRDRLHDLMDEP